MEKLKQVEMNDGNFYYHELSQIKTILNEIKEVVRPKDDLWDNADIIQNWHVSARTLADWRAKGLIGFVQVGNKIWYPREARELFLNKNFYKPKKETDRDGEEG